MDAQLRLPASCSGLRSSAPPSGSSPSIPESNSRNRRNPAESRKFLDPAWVIWGESLTRRLSGGGGSRGRTRLSGQFPDMQGKYREIFANPSPMAASTPISSRPSEQLATNSLRTRTGNLFALAGNLFRRGRETRLRVFPLFYVGPCQRLLNLRARTARRLLRTHRGENCPYWGIPGLDGRGAVLCYASECRCVS